MMKRAKGGTLAEIVKPPGWQPHTGRGFIRILGSKGGEKIESSKNAAGERTYKIGNSFSQLVVQTPPRMAYFGAESALSGVLSWKLACSPTSQRQRAFCAKLGKSPARSCRARHRCPLRRQQ